MPGRCKCVVPSCVVTKSTIVKFGVSLRFFSFPKDYKLRNKWLLKCNRSPSQYSDCDTICSRHFHINDYEDGLVSKIANVKPKRLKPDAVPSLFLQGGPTKLTRWNHFEYHKNLAQEILDEDLTKSSKSSDLPIYLDFSQSNELGADSSMSCMDTTVTQHLKDGNSDALEGVEDCRLIEDKKEPMAQSFVDCTQKKTNKNVAAEKKSEKEKFVGRCYVCDAQIRQCDLDKFSPEDFTKVVQKVLEGISTEYVIVMTPSDGLCGACWNVVTRICKLEAELRTATVGLRALLRLNYNLPPPVMEKKEQPQKLGKLNNSSSTQTIKPNSEQKNKVTQTSLVQQKNKKTQTNYKLFENTSDLKFVGSIDDVEYLEAEQEKIVGSIDDVEYLEAEGMQEEIVGSIGNVEYLEAEGMQEEIDGSIGNVEYLEAEGMQEEIVGSIGNVEYLEAEGMQEEIVESVDCPVEEVVFDFEDIADETELEPFYDGDCLAVEGEVNTECSGQINVSEEVNQPEKQRRSVTRKDLVMLKCSKCRFATRSSEEMKAHISSFINNENFYCYICDFAYHNADYYKKHAFNHAETSQNKRCIFCDTIVYDKLHMRFHIEANHKPNAFHHPCPKCNQVFMFGGQMRRHLKLFHKVMTKFTCETCNQPFGDKVKYDNHVEYYHRPSLTCKYCSRQYSTIQKLIVHENSAHRFDRAQHYQCSYCPRKFVRPELLVRHETHHTEPYDHRCGVCGYGFHEAEAMERHQRCCGQKMFGNKRGRPTNLSDTLEPLASSDQLPIKRVRRVDRDPLGGHQSLVCDVCGKIITTRSKYKIHREMHNTPACFQCEFCGKKFRYMDNMRAHKKNLHKDVVDAE